MSDAILEALLDKWERKALPPQLIDESKLGEDKVARGVYASCAADLRTLISVLGEKL